MPEHTIRRAKPEDAERILQLMRELAVYEKLEHLFVADSDGLRQWLFTSPVASALVAEMGGETVGYAVYFRSFSTFLGRPGIWLEDLYVTPELRGTGIGKSLLSELAREAVAGGCGRLEWAVLDWNQPAIDFYERIGADVMPDWRMCRLAGEKLERFSGTGSNGSS